MASTTPSTTSTYDLIVVGGGAAGLGAANAANRSGKRVLLINEGQPGGDCTFTGCVPSKALISQAAKGASFDEAMAHVRVSVDTIAATETFDVLQQHGISTLDGRAIFVGANQVEVHGRTYSAAKFVVATGSRAFVPPVPGLDSVPFLTNHNLFSSEADGLGSAPKNLAVLGGGPIGAELSQAFARLGIEVTVFEMAGQILSREEPEAGLIVADALRADGVDLRLGTGVTEVAAAPGGGVVLHAGDTSSTFEHLLVATGRAPNSANLGLEALGVTLTKRGHIDANDKLETSVEHIYAAGDVTGKLPFTHAADEMGRLAAGHALRLTQRWKFSDRAIPWTTFTAPEVARVGVTEAEAASMGGRVAHLPLADVDRAITDGATNGFVKIIAGPKTMTRRMFGGEIIGATIVAPRAGEMINEIALAMRTRMFIGRLAQATHAYPTWSFAIPQTIAQFFFEQNGHKARPARAN